MIIFSGATVNCEIIPIRHPVDDVHSVFTRGGSRMAYDIRKGHYQDVQTHAAASKVKSRFWYHPLSLHEDMATRIAERVTWLEIGGRVRCIPGMQVN